MLPISYGFYTTGRQWSGTYSPANFLWYDFSAGTASTNTNEKNTVASNGTLSRAWDFSGSGRHSTYNLNAGWLANGLNGKSALVSQDNLLFGHCFYDGASTGTASTFTIISFSWFDGTSGGAGFGSIIAPNQARLDLLRSGDFAIIGQHDAMQGIDSEIDITGRFNEYAIIGATQTFTNSTNLIQYRVFADGYGSGNYATASYSGFDSPPGDTLVNFGINCNPKDDRKVFELMIWDRHLTSTEIEDVYGYINNKWFGI